MADMGCYNAIAFAEQVRDGCDLGGVLHSVADVLRQPLLYGFADQTGNGGRDRDQNTEQNGDDDARNGGCFEGNRDWRVVQMAVKASAEMGDGLNAMKYGRGQQEGEDRYRGHRDEQEIDGPREALAPPAMVAIREVLVVIGAHRWGEA